MGAIIQLNDANDLPSARLTEYKIHMLADDAIERSIPLLLRRRAPPE